MDEPTKRRALALAKVSETALAHAVRYNSIPLRSAMERAASFLGIGQHSRWSPAVALAGLMLLAAALLVLIPADLTIEARGQLKPQRR